MAGGLWFVGSALGSGLWALGSGLWAWERLHPECRMPNLVSRIPNPESGKKFWPAASLNDREPIDGVRSRRLQSLVISANAKDASQEVTLLGARQHSKAFSLLCKGAFLAILMQ